MLVDLIFKFGLKVSCRENQHCQKPVKGAFSYLLYIPFPVDDNAPIGVMQNLGVYSSTTDLITMLHFICEGVATEYEDFMISDEIDKAIRSMEFIPAHEEVEHDDGIPF